MLRTKPSLDRILHAWVTIICVMLIAPVLIVIPMSLTDRSSYSFPPTGVSLKWYVAFFNDPNWYMSATRSLIIATVVSVLATTLAAIAALAIARTNSRTSRFVDALTVAPIIVPGVILAIAIYPLFLDWQLTETFGGFVIAHTVLAIPLAFIPLRSAFAGLDPNMSLASASLGARPLVTFFRVTLPLIRPSLLTAGLFSFLISFDEAIVSLFLSGPDVRTLPVELYRAVAIRIDPTIAAASTLVILISTSFLIIVGWKYTRHMQ